MQTGLGGEDRWGQVRQTVTEREGKHAPVYSVVVPVYNSAPVLPELHRRLTAVLQQLGQPYELIFVDDCGPRDSWPTLRRLAHVDVHVHAIQLMRNVGQSNATLCGLAHARGEFIIMMDDDLQHPPEEIPQLVQALSPEVDVVMGVPRDKQHAGPRRWGSTAMHLINALLLRLPAGMRFSSFRLLRRPVAQALLRMQTLSPALSPMIYSLTRRIVSVEVAHAPREHGRSGYSVARLLGHAMNNVVGYSMLPLRLLALVGGVGIVLSLGLAAMLFGRYLMGGISVPGWTTNALLLLLLLMSGFNFFAFAILGEYVLRILQRANGTPQYLVRARAGDLPLADPSDAATALVPGKTLAAQPTESLTAHATGLARDKVL